MTALIRFARAAAELLGFAFFFGLLATLLALWIRGVIL
jgi:hypothetical protein